MIGNAPHIFWSNSIDTQDPSSYTPAVKKEVLINLFSEKNPAEPGRRVHEILAKTPMTPL
jgi:hypothetical protein